MLPVWSGGVFNFVKKVMPSKELYETKAQRNFKAMWFSKPVSEISSS